MAKMSRVAARQAAAMQEMAAKQGTVEERLERVEAKLDEALDQIDALIELLKPAEEPATETSAPKKSRKADPAPEGE